MTTDVPAWLARIWVAAGVLGLAGGLVGAVAGWVVVSTAAGTAVELSEEAAAALDAAVELTSSLDGTFGAVADALREVQLAAIDGSVSMTQLAAASRDLSEVVTVDVPVALDGVVLALPPLVATAGVVDGAMRTLALVGVDYDPDEPLDDTLRRIESALAVVPSRLRAQSERLDAAVDGLAAFSSSALEVSGSLADIRVALVQAERLVAEVESSSRTGAVQARDLIEGIPAQAAWLRAIVVVLGGFVAGMATVPLFLGRAALLGRARQPGPVSGTLPDGPQTSGST